GDDVSRFLADGNPVTPWGKAYRTDQLRGFVEDFSDGEFEAVLSADLVHDRQFPPVRRPVREHDVLEQLARRSTFERHAGKGSRRIPDHLAPDGDRQLAGRGNGQNPRVREL